MSWVRFRWRRGFALVVLCFPAFASAAPEVTIVPAVATPPLRLLAASAPKVGTTGKEVQNKRRPLPTSFAKRARAADPVVQSSLPQPRLGTTAGAGYAGLGKADFGYTVNTEPPDTTGAAGTTQYVQWVNTALVVLDKASGSLLAGPIDGNQLFAPLGATHPCATNNDGDPLVLFDRRAKRWVLSQFSVENPFYQCVAVSQTEDATGAWWLYAFRQPRFNDYGKLGVWADAYYITYNTFNGDDSYAGARVCAMRRGSMLKGGPGKQLCFDTSPDDYGLLPADLEGNTLPPSGAPEYLVEIDGTQANALAVFRFHVDFATPANSLLTGPFSVAVAPFDLACGDGGTCIPQPSSLQQLDSLGDRLMYRLVYRKRGSVESLLVNHSVQTNAGAGVGVRWYELRPDGGSGLKVYQQSTFAPADNTHYRWLASMGMDRLGDIAMGYSAVDRASTIFPSIRVTGRQRGDALNTMQSEETLVNGTGSQRAAVERWGDYSTMTIDPVDDCTFWYTNEYLQSNGTYNWHTRIASFKFPGC
jgi:hypothetical protein